MQMQFNRKRQPVGRQLPVAEGRGPKPSQIQGVPASYQNVNEPIEALKLPTMALGPQKVNTRPATKLLAGAERGTSG